MEANQALKEIKRVKRQSLIINAALAFIFISLFSFKNRKNHFDEIDVERINIVSKDGKTDIIITNADRAPDVIQDGKVVAKRDIADRPAFGIYNGEGDEIGGWTFAVEEYNGQKMATTALLFDQYKNDEVMKLYYQEMIGGNQKIAGLEIKDRPSNVRILELSKMFKDAQNMEEGEAKNQRMKELQQRSQNGEFGGTRLFVGAVNGLPVLNMKDKAGKTRLQIMVDAEGNPKFQFFDKDGNTTYTLPNIP